MTIQLTLEELQDARESYTGYCTNCGAERYECEPDARNYECEECGENAVFGAEELLFMGKIEIVE